MTPREKLLNHKLFREKSIVIKADDDEIQVLCRQPSVGQRSEIMAEMKVGREGELKNGHGLSRGMALAVVYCALDPASRAPIFDIADLDALINSPSGSWVDTLSAEIMGLMTEAAEEAKK